MSWYSSLLIGVLPFLVLGFTASALANQLAFVAWGAAAVHAGLVRYGWQAGWRRPVLAAAALATLAAGSGTFAFLVARHREIRVVTIRGQAPCRSCAATSSTFLQTRIRFPPQILRTSSSE